MPAISALGRAYKDAINHKQEFLCACGCGQRLKPSTIKRVLSGKPNTGFSMGHCWKGKHLPETACAKMRGPRPSLAGANNPNYGKGLPLDRNPNWQGGKKVYRYIKGNAPGRNTPRDRQFAASIRDRDGKCILCGGTDVLNAHHIDDYLDHVDRRFDPTNAVTLCCHCHAPADNKHTRDGVRPKLLAYIASIYP